MKTIAVFHSPFSSKFGIPRQAGVVSELLGTIVFEKPYRSADAVRGMEDFDFLWLIWAFHANSHEASGLTVRPPRLGGNAHLGVFATRSPFRPNPMGLSSVRLHHIDYDCKDAPVIYVQGADLMDGTPIYDIKPYVTYTDSHPDARAGFTDNVEWQELDVTCSDALLKDIETIWGKEGWLTIKNILAQDPRPQYHHDSNRIYGMPYSDHDIHFRVSGNRLEVIGINRL